MIDKELCASVAYFMKRSYDRGLTTSTGGNISCRDGSIMLITHSGKDKASLSADDIAAVDIETGRNLTPDKKLSIETGMHRSIYLARPDACAVVHSHPVFCCLYSALDEEIDTALIAESWYLLDRCVKVPYQRMGSEELASAVAEYSRTHDAMLLENHGAIAVGKSLLNAFDRLECLEQSAKLTWLSRDMKRNDLDPGRRAGIAEMR